MKILIKEIKDEIKRLENINTSYTTMYEDGYNDGATSVYRYILSELEKIKK